MRSQSLAMSSPQAAAAPQQPENCESIPCQGSSLSPEWIHAITNLMGHPLTSEIGQRIQKWVFSKGILDYTGLLITWDPIEFGENRQLQKYEGSDGSITYLQSNTVKQLIGLINYMIQLISQKRHADQKYNPFYFILGEHWFNLTAHDMRSPLVNAVLENHRSQATPGTPMSHVTSPSSSASMRSPIHFVLHFNEQFRRLDELTDLAERMPESIKMALLQNAVKDIPHLSIVETLDECTSTTSGAGSCTHLTYTSYYNLLINACVRYDATNTSTPSKGRNVYTAAGAQDLNDIEEPHEAQFSPDIDTPSDDFYQVHQAKQVSHHLHFSDGSLQKANPLYTQEAFQEI